MIYSNQYKITLTKDVNVLTPNLRVTVTTGDKSLMRSF